MKCITTIVQTWRRELTATVTLLSKLHKHPGFMQKTLTTEFSGSLHHIYAEAIFNVGLNAVVVWHRMWEQSVLLLSECMILLLLLLLLLSRVFQWMMIDLAATLRPVPQCWCLSVWQSVRAHCFLLLKMESPKPPDEWEQLSDWNLILDQGSCRSYCWQGSHWPTGRNNNTAQLHYVYTHTIQLSHLLNFRCYPLFSWTLTEDNHTVQHHNSPSPVRKLIKPIIRTFTMNIDEEINWQNTVALFLTFTITFYQRFCTLHGAPACPPGGQDHHDQDTTWLTSRKHLLLSILVTSDLLPINSEGLSRRHWNSSSPHIICASWGWSSLPPTSVGRRGFHAVQIPVGRRQPLPFLQRCVDLVSTSPPQVWRSFTDTEAAII